MAVGVRTGEQSRVPGSGPGVGVVVVAVGKVRTMVEQQPEAAFAELIAVTLEIVATKLVNHNDDNELGVRVVG